MIEGHSLKLLPATEIFLIKIHKSQAKQFLEVDFKLSIPNHYHSTKRQFLLHNQNTHISETQKKYWCQNS